MRFILVLTIYCSFNSFAHVVTTQIHDIEQSSHIGENTLIFLKSGEVASISSGDDRLEALYQAKQDETQLKVILSDDHEILQFESFTSNELLKTDEAPLYKSSFSNFKPSVVKSLDLAINYFRTARIKNKDSQCFNRAHVWSYEWKINHRINSSKMFIFFSRKFIREHRFKWWFHIAPYLHVIIGNKIKERVMDMKFLKYPTTVMKWVEHFVKKSAECLTVKKYSDYANYPESGKCYLMRTSMYTYWPLDLEMEEIHGVKKEFWKKEELEVAYLEAFDIDINGSGNL